MSRISPIRFLLAALVTLVAGVFAGPQTALAVVSGSGQNKAFAVQDGDYPWTVAILPRGAAPTDQFCGGTLISRGTDAGAPARVLTAAHCIDPAGPLQATADSIDVLIDQASLCASTGGPQCTQADTNRRVGRRLRVADISLHKQADILAVGGPTDHFYYDLAILTLAEPLPSSYDAAVVQPIASAGENTPEAPDKPDAWGPETESTDGVDTFVAGWGLLSESSATAPNVMRFGGGSSMERLSDPTCAQRYPGEFRAADMLCVGIFNLNDTTTSYQGIDACQGDSGGPLLKRAFVQDYPTLSFADAQSWSVAQWTAKTNPERTAATAQALADLPQNDLTRLRTAAREAISAQQLSDWEAQIRANLSDDEKNLPQDQQDAIVSARLSAQVDNVVNTTVEGTVSVPGTAVVGTQTIYGNLYRQRQSDERSKQIASYMHEGRHWRLLGVVSWGEGCGRKEKPGVYARVGAPALRDYVTNPSPATMPHIPSGQTQPAATGTFALGESVVCQPGGWVGASDYTYTMWRDSNGDGSRSATDRLLTSNTSRQDYKVTIADVTALKEVDLAKGVSIGCTVRARGEGGYAVATGAVAAIPAPRQPTPGPTTPETPAPAPTPAPTTPAADTLAPQLSKKAAVCSKNACRVSIIALDPGTGAAGVKQVVSQLTIVRKAKCRVKSGKSKGKLRSCLKTTRKTIVLTHSGDQWVVSIKGLRKGDKLTLKFTGTDRSGNRSALSIPLKLRTSR